MSYDYHLRLADIFSRLGDHPSLRSKDIRPFLMGFSPFSPFNNSPSRVFPDGYNLPFTFSGVCNYSFAASNFLAQCLLPLHDKRYLIVSRCPDIDMLRGALKSDYFSAWFLDHFVASYSKRVDTYSLFLPDQDEIPVHFLNSEYRKAFSLDEHVKDRMYSLAFVTASASPFDFVSFIRDPEFSWRFGRMDQSRLGQFYRAFSELEHEVACDRTRRSSEQLIKDEDNSFSTFAALAKPIFWKHIKP